MSSKNIDPNVILFTVPCAEECGIYLTNITWDDSPEKLWSELHSKLSCFGLIYNIFVSPSKYKNEKCDRYFALVKYYSKKSAEAALTHSGCLFNDSVKICKMLHDSHGVKYLKLNSHAMEELISYYFGFNYWSLQVLQLKKDTSDKSMIKFPCVVKVTTREGLESEGIGAGEDTLNDDKSNHLQAFKRAMKFAVEAAKSNALSKFVIVELDNGKRLMEVNYQRPDPFYMETDLVTVCQVAELQSDPEDEEDDSFMTDQSLNESQWIENLPSSLLDQLLNDS